MFTLTEAHFTTEDEARAEIEARGWQPLVVDIEIVDRDLHWHDFDAVLTCSTHDGRVRGRLDDVVAPGPRRDAGGRAPQEHGDGRAVIGLAVDPSEMTRPINKTPESLTTA
jgi:hypothetical protein